MNYSAQQLVDTVCHAGRFSFDLIAGWEKDQGFREALKQAIEEQAVAKNWGCVCRLIWILQRFPNPALVPLLGRLLEERENDGCMEAIVDALNIMRDARAVGSLKRALSYRMPGDDLAFHFNKKVINALARIGTNEAETVITEATQDPEDSIRLFAKDMLTPRGANAPMRRSVREFGVYRAFKENEYLVVDGRCFEVLLTVGDVFRQVYRVTRDRPLTDPEFKMVADNFRKVALRIEKINFYRRDVLALDSGFTGRLYLSGQGQDEVEDLGRDVLGVEG
jgi:hypothetical protein